MYKQYIGGQLVEGQGRPMHIANPATGEIIATFAGATAQQATLSFRPRITILPSAAITRR